MNTCFAKVRSLASIAGTGLLALAIVTGAFAQASGTAANTRQSSRLPKENVPAVWPYPEVPPPKMFEAHPDAKPDPGMNRIDYWRKLCRLEAGEFVFRTVKNVEGIYLVRPRFVEDSIYGPESPILFDRYAPEDPTGWADIEIRYSNFVNRLGSKPNDSSYTFVEMPHFTTEQLRQWVPLYGRSGQVLNPGLLVKQEKPFLNVKISEMVRYDHFDRRDIMIRRGGAGAFVLYSLAEKAIRDEASISKYGEGKTFRDLQNVFYPFVEERVEKIRSRYGIYWRGIERPNDRAMGIAGGEVLLLDLTTNEVLAVKRSFVLGAENWLGHDIYWVSRAICPSNPGRKGGATPLTPFTKKVLERSRVAVEKVAR